VIEAIVVEKVGAVDAFKQDGMFVLEQAIQQLPARSRTDDIGQTMGKAFMAFVPGVVIHFDAIFV
jgi:hypothetical protein